MFLATGESIVHDKCSVKNKIFVCHKALTGKGLLATVSGMATFGENMKRIREAHKPLVTQRQIAEHLGHANPSNISTYENGDILPDPETVRRIAERLDCTTADLMKDVPVPHDAVRQKTFDVTSTDTKSFGMRQMAANALKIKSPKRGTNSAEDAARERVAIFAALPPEAREAIGNTILDLWIDIVEPEAARSRQPLNRAARIARALKAVAHRRGSKNR